MYKKDNDFSRFVKPLCYFLFAAVIGFLITNEKTKDIMYSFTFNSFYIYSIFLFMLIAFLLILFREKLRIKQIAEKRFYFFSYIFLAPVIFYPIFRCNFKIPYIFCHICPRKCIFGHLRPYLIPAILLMNVDKRIWCYNYCPIGKLQKSAFSVKTQKMRLPKFLFNIKYLIFLFVILSYFAFNNYFSKTIYSFSIIVLIIAIILLIMSFFIHRIFCNYICPIGTVSEGILKLERKIK